MKIVLIITCVILSPVILYGIALAVGFLDVRLEKLMSLVYAKNEEEKQQDANTERTAYPRRRRVARYIFLGTLLPLFAALSVAVFITQGVALGIMISVFLVLMALLPFFLCLEVWRCYEVISDEGIVVCRIFGKKLLRYTQMAYYKKDCGGYTDLYEITVYGSNNKRQVRISGGKVGMLSILNALEKHGIKNENSGHCSVNILTQEGHKN